ncbi:hypothetical protein CVV67_09680 [Arthrobacter stackebrandtii]|nr:hypothetical protein CVV67_09680 [Arthrobacter stackebrandtii]
MAASTDWASPGFGAADGGAWLALGAGAAEVAGSGDGASGEGAALAEGSGLVLGEAEEPAAVGDAPGAPVKNCTANTATSATTTIPAPMINQRLVPLATTACLRV